MRFYDGFYFRKAMKICMENLAGEQGLALITFYRCTLRVLTIYKTIRLEISGVNIKQLNARLRERESL